MLYEISNMNCAYQKANMRVLHVKDLKIPGKKITAILGLSGIGKSTFLETLGLMNNTLVSNEESIFRFWGNGSPEHMDFRKIWQNKNDSYISRIRNRHFSFIFQDTNLMPNFSAIENIMLTLMLQGYSKNEARKIAVEYLDNLGLGEIDPDKKVFELSGGQRQRIAFIRAICPEFTVLFGDEPTGNLDRFTSRSLMQILKLKIHEKGRAAIIVSHDIELSVEFADQLIVIDRVEKNSSEENHRFYGYIDNCSVFALNTERSERIWENVDKRYNDQDLIKQISQRLNRI